ncbi:MAG: sugar ABC transporter permease [Candidatus Aminicenantes bacterium]|nr:MAG: sugar ABC transporter permease [Candidatus Aminicenantes bacterium]
MKKTTSRQNDTCFTLMLVMPSILIIAALTLFPIVYNFYLSFFRKHAFLDNKTFIGLKNYASLIGSPEFWAAFKNGFIYASSTIVLQVVLGMAAALILNERLKGKNVMRGIFLFPYLMPTIVVIILWKWLLNASYGFFNYILMAAGIIEKPLVWFSGDTIMLTLVLISTWQFFPFVMVTVLARLQTIPRDLYRAARVDGAPTISRFIHITLPQLRNVLLTVILLRSIWMFTKFDTVWLLSGKEAIGKYIQTIPVLTYRRTFNYLQAGMGAALSVILFILLLTGAFIYLRTFIRSIKQFE